MSPPKHKMTHLSAINALPSQYPDFRTVLWTGESSQLVVMTVPVGGEIGEEVSASERASEPRERSEWGVARERRERGERDEWGVTSGGWQEEGALPARVASELLETGREWRRRGRIGSERRWTKGDEGLAKE
jgi:hypothetical protein